MNVRRTIAHLMLLVLLAVSLGGGCQRKAATAPGLTAATAVTSEGGTGALQDVDLPLCPGATRLDQESARLAAFAARSTPPGAAAAYTCKDDPKQVLDYYRAQLPPLGWTRSADLATKEGGILSWDKGETSAQAVVTLQDGKTVLLLGRGPKGADLLPPEGLATPGPTHTPRATLTRGPTGTSTPRPAGIDARAAYDQALARAREWSGDVVLLRAVAEYSRVTGEGGVDAQGGGLEWVFDFAKAGAQGDAQAQGFQVAVGLQGVSRYRAYLSTVKTGDYAQIGSVIDWRVTSAQAVQIAEAQGGKAYRDGLAGRTGIDATLTLACRSFCPDTPTAVAWEIRYQGAASDRVFVIDGTTGKVVSTR